MEGTTYKVVVDLGTTGNLGRTVAASHGAMQSLHGSAKDVLGVMGNLGSTMAGAFTGAVEKAGALAMTVGKIAAVGGFAAVAHSVGKLNAELESTQISIAGILNANGAVGGLDEGMKVAAGQMVKMRQDAKALPGEFGDLKNIFTNIAVPGLQAGVSADRLRSLSAMIMASSSALQVPMEVAARESAMLMMGRAGGHNILGMKLAGLGGDKAQEFNKMSAQGRVEYLEKSLGRFKPLIDAQGQSFNGLFSTMIDNTKLFSSQMSKPLFDNVKRTLTDINGWFDANPEKVSRFAQSLGDKLAHAWEFGVVKVKEWGPIALGFAQRVETRLITVWERIEPIVVRVAGYAKNMLGDPATLGRIEGILKMYAAMKLGGSLVSAGSSLSSVLGPLMSGGGGAGGLIGGIEALGPASIVAAGGVAALLATIDSAQNKGNPLYAEAKAMQGNAMSDAGKTVDLLSKAADNVKTPLQDVVDVIGTGMNAELSGTAYMAKGAASQLEYFTRSLGDSWRSMKLYTGHDAGKHAADQGYHFKTLDASTKVRDDGKAHAAPKGAGGGGGGTNIQKVEIVVSGSDDPSRIARVVFDHLAHLNRYPRGAKNVPNYSAHRG